MNFEKLEDKSQGSVLGAILNTTIDPGEEVEVFFDEYMDDGCFYPITHYVNSSWFSPAHRAFLPATGDASEPTNFRDVVAYEIWRTAMQMEISALVLNKTWDIVELPPGKTAIGCKWIYKIKYRVDGTVERYKARLVVFGNRQKEGVDYKETFVY